MNRLLALLLSSLTASSLLAGPAGYPDPAFGLKGHAFTSFADTDSITDIAIQPDKKIVAAGYSYDGAKSKMTIALARYNATGTLDITFGQRGRLQTFVGGYEDTASAVALQSDGKIVVAGWALIEGEYHSAVLRFLSNGLLDTTFGVAGRVKLNAGGSADSVTDVAIQADGKIVVAGRTKSGLYEEALLVRLTPKGALDTDFGTGGYLKTDIEPNADDFWSRLVILADQRILAMGNSGARTIMARFQTTGALDTTFGGAGKIVHGNFQATGLAVQPGDDKIVLSVNIPRSSNVGMARLNPNGSVDVTFDTDGLVTTTPAPLNSQLYDIGIQADGKYVVCGFGTGNVAGSNLLLMRFKTNGGLDSAFASKGVSLTDIAGDGEVGATLKFAADGAVFVGGSRDYERSGPPSLISNSDFALHRFKTVADGTLVFATEPVSQFLGLNETATLAAKALGDTPFTQSWLKNGALIPGSFHSDFYPPITTSADAGLYTSRVTNQLGSTVSRSAAIAVIQAPPPLLVVYEEAQASMTCPITAPAGVRFNYQWYFEGSPLDPTPELRGITSQTLVITHMSAALEGEYDCFITMIGPDRSVTRFRGVTQVQRPVQPGMSDFLLGSGSVGTPVAVTVPYTGNPNRFKITGLPPGVSYNPATGAIYGRPLAAGTYKVTVVASNQVGSTDPVEGTWEVKPFLEAGHFAGIITRNSAMDNGLALGGLLDFTVTDTAAVSGRVILGGITRSFTSTLNAAANGAGPSTLNLRVPAQGNLPILQIVATLVTNGETGNLVEDDFGNSAAVKLYKEQFRNPDAAARFKGAYTWLMEGASSPGLPDGSGFMTATIMPSGVVVWTGRLADDTAVTGSSFMAGARRSDIAHPIPMHQSLYGGMGSFQGHVILGAVVNESTRITADGGLDWKKERVTPPVRFTFMRGGIPYLLPPTIPDRTYTGGFPLHNLVVSGGQYLPPAPGERLLGFEKVDSPASNGELAFADGALTTSFTQKLTLTADHQAVLETPAPGQPLVTFSISALDGTMTGTFKVTDPNPLLPGKTVTRTATFSGVLVPRFGFGGGFFILPELPAAGPPVTTPLNSPALSGPFKLWAPN